MNFISLKNFLGDNSKTIEWAQTETDMGAIYLKSLIWGTIIRIELDKLNSFSKEDILMQLVAGKNVEKITRITGYFSKTNFWNTGKLAELKDRYRVKGTINMNPLNTFEVKEG